jgi:WhiB family transcriptional regulator, redox-sensing transcriptional regulator
LTTLKFQAPEEVKQPMSISVLEEVTSIFDPVIAGLGLPCRQGDPDLWFAETPSDVEQAKLLCTDCPVRQMCLTEAKDRREPWGVWGGELFAQGTVIPKKRPRGRPRKSQAAA